ncbi:glycosyltransferase family 4 protein [Phormidium sp. CCY1219]|uniref:glycosyltransferase family 4 protein n=1 Tax=Phormidium sp. CCY1219 TaxID=2886104 RepID=UPI002D1F3942|nr:glycosyltransferase family 4 protein [Phormidium sp. CCY1219]MEB3829839.1 glycosyltransferase family 4 protein [Phormidium sp. CCY1219]
MKILHLSQFDIEGGAARGAFWLHNALQQAGVESQMLVASKDSHDPAVLGPAGKVRKGLQALRCKIDSFPLSLYPEREPLFSLSWWPTNTHKKVAQIAPDIINLHWVGLAFVTPESLLKFNKPIVWTLRDMWTFTGGCYYSGDCKKYINQCGACPALNSSKPNDISRIFWNKKFKAWEKLNFTGVTISHWLADCARQSSIFKNKKIQVIHNALDESKYKPMPKKVVRDILGLNPNKKIVLFGAVNATSEKRKGFQYLVPALQKLALSGLSESIELVVFGSSEPENPPELGMKTTYLGWLNDDISLAILYAAADVTIVPSLQEAFGKTAMESLACGTPVVSFDSTGLKDIVEHQKNGYRAECFSAEDLANGIRWVLEDEERWQSLSRRAREKVEEEFTLKVQARNYLKLYEEILESSRESARG